MKYVVTKEKELRSYAKIVDKFDSLHEATELLRALAHYANRDFYLIDGKGQLMMTTDDFDTSSNSMTVAKKWKVNASADYQTVPHALHGMKSILK